MSKILSLLDNSVFRITVGTASVMLLSEVVYQWYAWYVERIVRLRRIQSQSDIDIIWVNELSGSCSNSGPKTHNKKCKNKFCYFRNADKLAALIDRAKYTIDLSMYIFTAKELSNAFLRALKRGVDIRIISDRETVYTSGSKITELSRAGVPIRFPLTASSKMMHHKFCILDGPNRCRDVSNILKKSFEPTTPVLFSGSLNWTFQGLCMNWENSVIISNLEAIKQFEDEFQRMWIAFKNINHEGPENLGLEMHPVLIHHFL